MYVRLLTHIYVYIYMIECEALYRNKIYSYLFFSTYASEDINIYVCINQESILMLVKCCICVRVYIYKYIIHSVFPY